MIRAVSWLLCCFCHVVDFGLLVCASWFVLAVKVVCFGWFERLFGVVVVYAIFVLCLFMDCCAGVYSC